ncbi:hypothetical protein EBZ97_02925 [bacterium]|nr:hypothetical protein [bacterium]
MSNITEYADMGQRDRWLIFMLGALIGAGLLWTIQSKSEPARTEKRRVRESLNLPGMMYDYAVTKKGFYGHFVLFESIETLSDGSKVRTIVTGGRRHYNAEGNELPQEYLLITETYAAGTPLAEEGPVTNYTFSFADRLTIKLRKGYSATDVTDEFGDVATPVADRHDLVTLKLTNWIKSHQAKDWSKLNSLIKELSKKSAVQSVELTKIDWQSEAELIKQNSTK